MELDDENESDEFISADFDLESGLVFPSETFWVEGIHLGPYNCPDCLRQSNFDCDDCSFFSQEDCRLLNNPDYRHDIKTIFDIARERNLKHAKRQIALCKAISRELGAHGRPLHYAVIARIVQERNPGLGASEKSISRILANNSLLFERVDEGVYRCR